MPHHSSSTLPHPGPLTSGHWSRLPPQLERPHLCPGHAEESQEHGQEARPAAPQPRGGLQPEHGSVGQPGSSLAPPSTSSSLHRLDGAIHNFEESGWAGRQKEEAGE